MKPHRVWKTIALILPLLLSGNLVLLWAKAPWLWGLWIAAALLYPLYFFLPYEKKAASLRLTLLSRGIVQLRHWGICQVVELLLYLLLMLCRPFPSWYMGGFGEMALNWLVFAVLQGIVFLAAMISIGTYSKQVKWYWYLLILLFWWFPLVGFVLFIRIFRTAKRELQVENARLELDSVRKENEICATKYPVLLVHGIFFRDWQFFNYWGRIPAALQKNGAAVYYGHQQSAQSIADSAKELQQQILGILEETGAEKLNIIAHSKGGLDIRYAMTHLGLAPYVASLTTINTPHHGCAWVEALMGRVPDAWVQWVAGRYNTIFQKLGDAHPDFLAGVQDLTESRCMAVMQDCTPDPAIPHHCVMSQMCSLWAAPFPLWLGYACIGLHRFATPNDGLVPVETAQLDDVPFTLLPKTKRRGISHGDMIDLFRENIKDFDVREFYVQLVADLKAKGL